MDEKLGVYINMGTGAKESILQSRKALKLLKECSEAKFALLEKGPSITNVKGTEALRLALESVNQ
jgi:hypothetical protein